MTHNAVRPKLVLSGASDALQWYADVLGATLGQRYQIGEQVVFANLVVLGTTITLKDTDEADPVSRPGPILDCVVDDPDATAARMVEAGGEVVFPVADQPYGARGGRARPVRSAVAPADPGHDDAGQGAASPGRAAPRTVDRVVSRPARRRAPPCRHRPGSRPGSFLPSP